METFLNMCLQALSLLFMAMFFAYTWNRLLDESHPTKSKVIISIFLIVIIIMLINMNFEKELKMILSIIFLIIANYFFYSHNIRKAITSVFITHFIIIISETLISIFVYTFLKTDVVKFSSSAPGNLIINKSVTILSFIMLLIFKKWKNIIQDIDCADDIRKKEIITYMIILFVFAIVSTLSSYGRWNSGLVLLINIVTILIFLGFLSSFIDIQLTLQKINSKYQTSISSLKEYEVMIDKFRVDTHENKNEFLTIRNMLKDKNSKDDIVKYIDKLVDNKIKDNDKIMKKTAKIPSGGLRATIYSKLCLMEKLKIKYTLNISRDIRTTDLIDLDEDLVLKICKILGVFLDNAIEAVKSLKKKEIAIEMYNIDNELCIDITNNFEGNLDLDKINNMKYTTKGEGRGYGLTLVNKLLEEESDKLENEKSVNRDTFTQTLKIKM